MNPADTTRAAILAAVNEERLLKTAQRLMGTPSFTGEAAEVLDDLAQLLTDEGFPVERVEAGWPQAPAVAARLDSGVPGRTLQFNGHLDTVHLPYAPPQVTDGVLTGTGCSDMKGGVAAAIEAMRALRDSGQFKAGSILLTGHDLHEAPWGDGSQVDGLIDAGFVGDAVLIPEYLASPLPVVGRGLAVFEAVVRRSGEPVHEVLGGIEQPNVLQAGAELILALRDLDARLADRVDPRAGRESVFVGQVHCGEIFNQSPIKLEFSGTRRWLARTDAEQAKRELLEALDDVAKNLEVELDVDYQMIRDAFELDESIEIVQTVQRAYEAVTGAEIQTGAKPFVDDCNAFIRRGGVPAITHGPHATGAHTVDERCPVSELVRVAQVYALTAIEFCARD